MKIGIPGRKNKKNTKTGKVRRGRGKAADSVPAAETEFITFGTLEAEEKPRISWSRRSVGAADNAGAGAAGGFAADTEDSGFAVNVRNSEPILSSRDAEAAGRRWSRDLVLNTACAGLVTAFISLFLMGAEAPDLVPFAAAGFAVFMIISEIEAQTVLKVKWIAAGVVAALLIAAMVIWHGRIGSGLALIMNQFYDIAEEAQAYLYTRLPVGSAGDDDPDTCMMLAVLWISALLGLIAALPNAGARRSAGVLAAVIAMFAFAYYGLIPAWTAAAAVTAALIFVLSRGNILASLPLVLIAGIVFGAVLFIDPGENYTISRADENFRDRFALVSAQLESEMTGLDTPDSQDADAGDTSGQNTDTDRDNNGSSKHGFIAAISTIVIILAAAAALAALFCSRLRKKRDRVRAGLDSEDPRTAIVAMFPYAVRWLGSYGIDAEGRPFPALLPQIRSEISLQYAERYEDMYSLWREAAYSDHEMTEDDRGDMDRFVRHTIKTLEEDGDLRDKLRARLRYAL